jgi:subtilisin family serine protease
MKKFHQTSTTEFELVSNEVNYLFEQYVQIHQFIKTNFSEEYHNLLAKPERVGPRLEWYTPLGGTFVMVEVDDAGVRERMLAIYNARRYGIEHQCVALANDEDFDKKIWAGILQAAFNPNHIQLFTNGADLVLVWGIKTGKMNDYLLPIERYQNLIIPNSASSDSTEDKDDLIADDPIDHRSTDEHIEEIPSSDSSIETIDESFDDQDNPEDMDDMVEPVQPDPMPTKPPGIERMNTPKHWFYSMLDRFEAFARRFWWLLLILLLLFIIMMLRGCDWKRTATVHRSEAEIEERYAEIAPPTDRRRIISIDTTQFREDENTGSIVIGGLLNIAMVDQKDRFKQMAVELKAVFPDSAFRIVYVNEETRRLQLQYPDTMSVSIKDRIRSGLSGYKILVWDESVFTGHLIPNDPFFKDSSKSWHLDVIHAPEAWNITQGDTSVVVAIIDDGFDLKHPEFSGARVVNPYNVMRGNTEVYGGGSIVHGTHVAALAIGRSGNGAGGSGIAPNCSFMPVQISDGGDYFLMSDVADGILYALNHGADVINLSLGKMFGPGLSGRDSDELQRIIENTGKDEEQFWKELFALADEKNVSIVLAGGNEALPIGLDPMQRSESTLKVLAIGPNLKRAVFSNYPLPAQGNQNFISSPGVQIFSAVPDGQYLPLDGTSMAAPIVSGAIALIKTRRSDLKNSDIFELLSSSGRPSTDGRGPAILQIDKAIYGLRP